MRHSLRRVIAAFLLALAGPAMAADEPTAPSGRTGPAPATERVLHEEITSASPGDEAAAALAAGLKAMEQRRFDVAERQFRQVLGQLERRFGPEHFSTRGATSRHIARGVSGAAGLR